MSRFPSELRAEMRRISDRIATEMKAIVNPFTWQEPENLRRITPTAAECFAYFRTATEPPPRRFKFVRAQGKAERNAKWLAGAGPGEQRAIITL